MGGLHGGTGAPRTPEGGEHEARAPSPKQPSDTGGRTPHPNPIRFPPTSIFSPLSGRWGGAGPGGRGHAGPMGAAHSESFLLWRDGGGVGPI